MSEVTNTKSAVFYGVGVGPGDPELITLKAHRLIQQSDLITYLTVESGQSMARDIAAQSLDSAIHPGQQEQAFVMPMCESRDRANAVYDEAAAYIAGYLEKGKTVVFLCQGDPLFFGSFAYLHDRLGNRFHTEVIPGISSINASVALTGRALGLLAENVAIISGRRDNQDILNTLNQFDNVAIMKPGRRRQAIIGLLKKSGRIEDTSYIEYAGQAQQKIVTDITRLDQGPGPYFSLFLVNCQRNDG